MQYKLLQFIMLQKTEIEQAYLIQQSNLHSRKRLTDRTFRKKINTGSSHIKVISGVRRCGKSTLMKQLIKQFSKKIAYFNFEDSRVFGFDIGDFQKLDEIMGNGMAAYFFDEIQNIPNWEIFIRNLHEKNQKIFITGSNASLLSKELGTRLTGRHLRYELFPFSYTEFLVYKKLKNNLKSFEKYISHGGFPEYLDSENQDVLQSLVKDIVLRDVAVRHSIKNTKTLMDVTLFLLSNIGKECTFNSIKNSFSIGSANSVSDYLTWLEDSYLIFLLKKFSWSAKNILVNPRKVYAIDNGLINANSLSFTKDKGRLLENAVYLFLRQKPVSLFYFREKGECDFVVFEKEKCIKLIQVCEELHSENKNREINGLLEAMDFFKLSEGWIITKNQSDILDYKKYTITLLPAHQLMTSEKFIF